MVSSEDHKKIFEEIERYCPHTQVQTAQVNHLTEKFTDDGTRPNDVRLRVGKIYRAKVWVGNIWAYLVPTTEEPFRLVFRGIRFFGVPLNGDFKEDWNVVSHILIHRKHLNDIAFQYVRGAEELKAICLYYFIAKKALAIEDLGEYVEVLIQYLRSILVSNLTPPYSLHY
jgi:hypothetical protein